MRFSRNLGRALLAGILLAALACGAGCGQHKEAGTSHLDPMALANQDAFGSADGVPVICYHYLRPRFAPGYLARVAGSLLFGMPALQDKEFWTLPAAEFEKHLQFFAEHGIQVVTLDEIADRAAAGLPLPHPAVVLTFDDAERSIYTQAWPLLQKYGVRAHLFVPAAMVGNRWSGLDMCSWAQLKEMESSGAVILESHTNRLHYKARTNQGIEPVFWHPERVQEEDAVANLRDLNRYQREVGQLAGGKLPELRRGMFRPVTEDLLASRAGILHHTGAIARWLAWPYGYGNGDLDSVASLAGFRGTVSLMPRTYTADSGNNHVGRFTVTAKTTLDMIAALFPAGDSAAPVLAGNTEP